MLEQGASASAAAGWPGPLEPVIESPTHDPVQNIERESLLMKTLEIPSYRVWRSTDSVVLGRFLAPEKEVYLARSKRLGVPVLKRPSGGGAVFHDLGNINYSIYLHRGNNPLLSVEESLLRLSFPVTYLLDSLGVSWTWEPPNNIYVCGRKISGSAQARSKKCLLHHGTLLVTTDLDRIRRLLKPGGRSRMAPVINLSEIVPGITPEDTQVLLHETIWKRSRLGPEPSEPGSRQEPLCLSRITK